MKKLLAFAGLILLLMLGWLLFGPSPIDPLPFEPKPAREMTGVLEPNTILRRAEHLGAGYFDGPEDIAIDADGNLYGGSDSGLIHRMNPAGNVEVFANTGGRPLGMQFDAHGNLIVADAWMGLLSIRPDGSIDVLARESKGIPLRFTNDLDIATDGTIYFTDASDSYTQAEYLYDLLEARPHGRLMKYDPESRTTTTLLEGLYFANGVALSQNKDFLIVNETYRYRNIKYHLTGPLAGTSEIFMENLPGFPDNISSTGDGRFWLAFFTVRNEIVDRLHPSPFRKKMLSRLPAFMWPKPAPYGFVAEIDENGNFLRTFQDPGGQHLSIITSVKEIDGKLYTGSLYNDRVGMLDLSLLEVE